MNIDKSKVMVTTSKFLEIKKEVQQRMADASAASFASPYSSSELEIRALEYGFNSLCDLLHELIVEESD